MEGIKMNPTEEQICKELHGFIEPDGCWHIINEAEYPDESCKKCRKVCPPDNPDYFTKEGFWTVLDFMKEKHPEGLKALLHHGNKQYYIGYIGGGVNIERVIERIDYKTFAREVLMFLKEGEK
jgi:hypothetical protein